MGNDGSKPTNLMWYLNADRGKEIWEDYIDEVSYYRHSINITELSNCATKLSMFIRFLC